MANKKDYDIPIPPIPKSLLPPEDPHFEKPEPQKPEDLRARMQWLAGIALDALEWHARNIADPKSSQEACRDLLDRAGYVAPAKGKAEGAMPMGGSMGEVVPPVEDEVRRMSESFSKLYQAAPASEEK